MKRYYAIAALLLAPIIGINFSQAVAYARPITKTISMKVNQSTVITMPPGQKARRLWMDDSSFADIDSEKPLSAGASVLYIVPRKAGTTRITIISTDASGRKGTNILTLNSGYRGISPDHVELGRQGKIATSKRNAEQIQAIEKGLKVALATQKVEPQSLLHKVLANTVEDIKLGYSPRQAADNNNIFYSAIQKLEELGQSRKPPKITPKPENIYTARQENSQQNDKLLARISELEQKIAVLSQRQDSLDYRQAQLEKEQGVFLAKFNDLSNSVLALENVIKPSSHFALAPGGKGGDIVSRPHSSIVIPVSDQKVNNAARPKTSEIFTNEFISSEIAHTPGDIGDGPGSESLLPKPSSQEPNNVKRETIFTPIASQEPQSVVAQDVPNNHVVANSMMNGLVVARTKKQIGYNSPMWRKVNSLVRLIRRGDDLKPSLQQTRVPESVASQLLKWGEVNPQLVGLK